MRPTYFKEFYRVRTHTDIPEMNFETQADAENYYFSIALTQRISCIKIIPSGGNGFKYHEGHETIHIKE